MIKTTIIKICGNDYNVKFPTAGELMDIEAFKIAYTNGRYVEMAMGGLKTQAFALDLADSLAYLSVLVPELKQDLKIKNWRELDSFIAKQIVKDFKNGFLQWYQPIVNDLYNFDVDEIEEDNEQSQE